MNFSLFLLNSALQHVELFGQPDPNLRLGGPKIALRGGGGGAPEMGFRAGPFVLCKDGCATKGAGTQILARKFFFTKKFCPTYV